VTRTSPIFPLALALALALALLLSLSVSPAAADPSYRWPLAGGTVTAYYDHGNVTDWRCQSNTYSGHDGTDIGVPRQTQIFAALGGRVKHRTDGFGDGYLGSTDGGGFGNAAAIFHGDGDETIYGHMSANTGIPALGAMVDCGAHIGRSGTSGSSTGPHLHFETRVGVSETGSYYSGSADDPFAGPCGGPLSYWRDQGTGMPSTACGGPPPPVDDAAFVADVTIPDGTEVVAGTTFTKIWRLRNSGTSTWGDGYTLEHVDGPVFGASAVALAATAPGAEIEIAVTMTASGEGTQRSSWQVAHDGTPFGQIVWTEVVVVAAPSSDADGDGVGPGQDCDDGDATVFPGAEEQCDGVDGDCDGVGDDGLVRTCCEGTATCSGGAWAACSVPCDEDPSGTSAGGCAASAAGAGSSGGRTSSAFWFALMALAVLAAIRRAGARSGSRSE
jgi:MYXO-CTERM domain-containing protein